MDGFEIVLIERPTHIKVRIIQPKSNGRDSELTLTLKPRVAQWSREEKGTGNVQRIGFSLVPEFGGTVHAYSGST